MYSMLNHWSVKGCLCHPFFSTRSRLHPKANLTEPSEPFARTIAGQRVHVGSDVVFQHSAIPSESSIAGEMVQYF